METLYLVIGVAVGIWLLTTKKFRKTIGENSTHSVHVLSTTITQSLQTNQLNGILDFEEELAERGTDFEKAQTSVKSFNELFAIK